MRDKVVSGNGTPGIDDNLEVPWALGAGRRYFFLPGRQDEWMPVLLRLNGISARDFADMLFIDDAEERRRWKDVVRVAPFYLEADAGADAAPYCTAMVREEFFRMLERDARIRKLVESVTIGPPLDSDSLPPVEDGGTDQAREP